MKNMGKGVEIWVRVWKWRVREEQDGVTKVDAILEYTIGRSGRIG